jgi:hypothetical protein
MVLLKRLLQQRHAVLLLAAEAVDYPTLPLAYQKQQRCLVKQSLVTYRGTVPRLGAGPAPPNEPRSRPRPSRRHG